MSDPVKEENGSAHLGVNQRMHGRHIDPAEMTDLVNVDISTPGIRTKRLEPLEISDLENDAVGDITPGGGGGNGGGDPPGDITCTATVSPTEISTDPCELSGSITITTSHGSCSWSASSSSWINLGASGGTGNGTLAYTIEENDTTSARTGQISVAGITIQVTQEAKTVDASPASEDFTASGGTGTITVTTNGSCVSWATTEAASWITIDSGSTGTGDGSVGYTVDPNDTINARSAVITITNADSGDNDTVTINQEGAAFDCAASRYRIVGYSSTFFGVPTCGADSGLTAWDGTFPVADGGCVFGTGVGSVDRSIRGKQFAGGLSKLDGATGTIALYAEPGQSNIIWTGTNSVANPLKFTRTDGCSATPAFLRVEEY